MMVFLMKAGKEKVIIVIQSRLREEDTSGFLQELDGFDTLQLPLLYTGEASKGKFKSWRIMQMSKVEELINQLRSIVQDNSWKWYEPLISRNNKEILLEWWHEGNRLSIYVEDRLITYIKVWGCGYR